MAGFFSHLFFHLLVFVGSMQASSATSQGPKYIMYLTGQHPIIPALPLIDRVTHVALAFMRSETFLTPDRDSWPLFTSVEETRAKFAKGTKVLVAIGGWGNEEGFREAARSEERTEAWCEQVRRMIEETGADGVDIDWEYPGGNGEDYKRTPNAERKWEIDAYPRLLSTLRRTLGPEKIISAAVPGLPRDMLAFTRATIPSITASLDFLNVMTYDLMNRRDNVTKHHTGITASLEAIDAYIAAGVPPEMVNLGLAFYVKWFKTSSSARAECKTKPVGCRASLMEDPDTGADLGRAGAFSWHDEVPGELKMSFAKAVDHGTYDEIGGGHYYFDSEEDLFWSWDTPEALLKKFPGVVEKRGLGGVFAWGLGEDAEEWRHLEAANEGVRGLGEKRRDRSEL